MDHPSFGSGGALLGGMQGVEHAMPQDGGSNVLTQQQSPSAPGFDPSTQVPPQPAMPQGSPTSHLLAAMKRRGVEPPTTSALGIPIPQNAGSITPGVTPPTETPNEAQMLIKALQEMAKPISERINIHNKKADLELKKFEAEIAHTKKTYELLNEAMRHDMVSHGEGTNMPSAENMMGSDGNIKIPPIGRLPGQ